MSKVYVLDTSVLLSSPKVLTSLHDSIIIIPAIVLEELDRKKHLGDEIGRNARYVIRQLDDLCKSGNLLEGVKLSNGSILRIEETIDIGVTSLCFSENKNDNKILSLAFCLQQKYPKSRLTILTEDILMRVKANALGVYAEGYTTEGIQVNNDRYTGVAYIESGAQEIASIRGRVIDATDEYYENQFVVFKNKSQEEIFIHKGGKLYPLYNVNERKFVFGLWPKNPRQAMALELLLDSSIPLVTISGKAGTGKTLLGLAAGLEQTFTTEKKVYDRFLAFRPIIPMGRDVGYLPGEVEDKIDPYMHPLYDNLAYLLRTNDVKKTLSGYEDCIEVGALTYIRGRSIANKFILIDEAQNLTKHEMKTIVTRVGEGSKIVFVGDPDQIDHPDLDAYNNGFTHLIEKMKEYQIAGHIELERGERSELSRICADVL